VGGVFYIYTVTIGNRLKALDCVVVCVNMFLIVIPTKFIRILTIVMVLI